MFLVSRKAQVEQMHCEFYRTKNVKGSALFIAITISALIAIILGLFLFFARIEKISTTLFLAKTQLDWHLESGHNILQADDFNAMHNNQWISAGNNEDSIRVCRKPWGAYFYVSIEAKNRKDKSIKAGIYGRQMTPDTALVISESGKALGVAGSLITTANCYLPANGIVPLTIANDLKDIKYLQKEFVKHAPRRIQALDVEFVNGIIAQKMYSEQFSDSIISWLPNLAERAFELKTLVWKGKNCTLETCKLKGNVKLVAEEITIENTAQLDNVVLICKKIRFKAGFQGKVHIICSDSIICEENCSFLFPSSFVLVPEEQGTNSISEIKIANKCVFAGSIIAFEPPSNKLRQHTVIVSFSNSAIVSGFVYVDGYLNAAGKLLCTVFADRLMVKTDFAFYDNSINQCEFDPKKHAGYLAVAPALSVNGSLVICDEIYPTKPN